VLCDPILILNFVLSSINPVGNPSHIVFEIMRGFLGDGAQFEEILFDIGSDALVKEHERAMGRLMRQVAKCIYFVYSGPNR
jgi:hypothetical protein